MVTRRELAMAKAEAVVRELEVIVSLASHDESW
jgi:hypothetical protein